MVGITQVLPVIRQSLEILVVEDVVDTHFLVASEGVHESAATLLETVDLVAQHRVIDVGVGHIVEVTADDGRMAS